MKKTFAILCVSAVMLVSLTACGGNMTESGTGGAAEHAGRVLREDAGKMRYGNHDDTAAERGNLSGGRKTGRGNTNATPNARLRGSYNNPTGTPGDSMLRKENRIRNAIASYRPQDEEVDPAAAKVRYQLMLENARVRDRDGFLLHGENTHHDTY